MTSVAQRGKVHKVVQAKVAQAAPEALVRRLQEAEAECVHLRKQAVHFDHDHQYQVDKVARLYRENAELRERPTAALAAMWAVAFGGFVLAVQDVAPIVRAWLV